MHKMSYFCDLHIHTTASDGEITPEKLADILNEYTEEAIVAVADHDTNLGYKKLKKLVEPHVTLIPCIEFSTSLEDNGNKRSIHVLGYFVKECGALAEYLNFCKKAREERIYKIVEKLNESGIKICAEEVFDQNPQTDAIGTPHIAKTLVEKEYAKTKEEAIKKYFVPGQPTYVPRKKIFLDECIEIIKKSSGVAVLAHPGKYSNIEDLLKHEFDGIEVWHPRNNGRLSEIKQTAENKIKTFGSDFHGDSDSMRVRVMENYPVTEVEKTLEINAKDLIKNFIKHATF